MGHSLRDQVTALSKQKKEASSSVTSSLRDQMSSFSAQRREAHNASTSASYPYTPRATLPSAPFGPYSSSTGALSSAAAAGASVRASNNTTLASGASPSPSPLNIMRSLPTDLSGILEHIHFPSIQSPAPNPLEVSASSFTTAATASAAPQSLHSSTQNFNASFAQGMVNFFEPLDESMEPIPLREFSSSVETESQPSHEQQQHQHEQHQHEQQEGELLQPQPQQQQSHPHMHHPHHHSHQQHHSQQHHHGF